LVASVPVAANAASTAICPVVEAASGLGVAEIVETGGIVERVSSAMATPGQYDMTYII
jgi:hypothetical protein